MKRTLGLMATACLLAAATTAPMTAADPDPADPGSAAQCSTVQTQGDPSRPPDANFIYNDETIIGFYEIASFQAVIVVPCPDLADMYACLRDPAACVQKDKDWILRFGMTYAVSHTNAVFGDTCNPVMNDYEVLMEFNTKNITAPDVPEQCVSLSPGTTPRGLPHL